MKLFRKLTCLLLVTILLLSVSPAAFAAESTDAYVRQMIRSYRAKEAGALDTIDSLLESMTRMDRDKANTWRGIMESWDWINREMEIHANVLPDGLTQEDQLAIVVMGYSLGSNGTMKPELIGRLEVALQSAEKYPNAYIVCTGGATSDNGVTEAGAMAAWLIRKGVDPDRIITEEKALSTSQNAKNVYRLLTEQYPQVKNVAVVTSDYHMKRSCLVMSAMSAYAQGYQNGEPLKLVANAAYVTGEEPESVYTQAQALAEVVGIPLDSGSKTSGAKNQSTSTETVSAAVSQNSEPASSIQITGREHSTGGIALVKPSASGGSGIQIHTETGSGGTGIQILP